MYELNGFRAELTWRTSGVIYFARDPLRPYFHDPQKNEIYFLNSVFTNQPINKNIWHYFQWISCFFFFYYYLRFTARQDYFTYFEPS